MPDRDPRRWLITTRQLESPEGAVRRLLLALPPVDEG
jgi:hypothetical protein